MKKFFSKKRKKINKNKISFSIITVSLNEKKIFKTFKSLKSQSYKNFEHIVIDGGSDDETINIIKKNSHNISYWVSEKDKGIYDAMNKGIKLAKGDIIGILNADDYYYKNTLKIVKGYFEKYNIDFLFGSVMKERLMHGFWPEKIFWKFNIYPSHSGGFFIKRKAQKTIGYYNLKYKYSSDRDLIYRMIVKHKFRGMTSNKYQILSKFDLSGISSRVSFLKRLMEETRIRLDNKQNFIFVIFLFIIHTINKIYNFIKKS